ncbi:MAG: ATP-binding protein [Erysipelotrichaceae bacterium]|nr:ATP-binding protein [Erysipelotrichaceae bacterium]
MKTERTKNYLPRIQDKELEDLLADFGAVLIRGPKWCGKTTSAERLAESAIYLNDPDHLEEYEEIASQQISLFLEGENPHLIDEWQTFPSVWDAVRGKCDHSPDNGLFLLTGSISPKPGSTKHTGAMRISRLDMESMSLWESDESSGDVSFAALFSKKNGPIKGRAKLDKAGITAAIVRGGWPKAIAQPPRKLSHYGEQAFVSICETDIQEATGLGLSKDTTAAILASLARNITIPVTNETIIKDVNEHGQPLSEDTFYEYIKGLRRLFVLREVPAWNPNVRSATAIRSIPKKEFYDPSIACAALGLGVDALSYDFKTRGYFFESMAGRDLSVYASALGGSLSYYRDRYGLECDFVVHLPDGRYGLFECKTGSKHIEEGSAHLNKLLKLIKERRAMEKSVVLREPEVMVIITDGEFAYRREDGIVICPLSCLKP